MRINTNVSALNAHRNLSQTNSALNRSMAKLSSGFRITRAADDAAGLAIANKFKADIRSLNVANRNISEATSLVQIAEGAASTINDILVRMKELATQASSSNASSQGATLQAEFVDLRNEIDRIVGATKYQNTALLDGAFAGTFQVGSGTTTNDRIALTMSQALDVTGTGTAGLDLSAEDISTLSGAQAAMTKLDAAVTTVNTQLGKLGAYQNRLDYASRNVSTTIENYSASESVIRDVDMAQEMTSFSKYQILSQAGTAMLAQANSISQGVLQLLRG